MATRLVCLGAKNPETIRMVSAIKKHDPDFEFWGFIDNDPNKAGQSFFGYPVFGDVESQVPLLARQGVVFCNLITGNTQVRYQTSKEMVAAGADLVNFIHPSVNLEMVELGRGNYIQEQVIIQAGVKIGDNSSIHIGTLVGHETTIGNSVFIAHGCSLSGEVEVGDGVFMGTHATVIPRVKIGAWSVIGAGAVILKDVPPNSLVVGNPGVLKKTLSVPYRDGKIV